jgi:hypothetical protein
MMKTFKVPEGTLCRVVDLFLKTDTAYTTTHLNEFTTKDVVFEPVSWLENHNEVIGEYGFRGGNVQQRARYVMVVPMIHVEVSK